MVNKIKTEDGNLEVCLFDDGMVEIESSKFKNVSVNISPVDPTDPLTPPGALYHIALYLSDEETKVRPFEYDSAWVMGDGKILKRGKEYSEYMAKQRD